MVLHLTELNIICLAWMATHLTHGEYADPSLPFKEMLPGILFHIEALNE